MPVKDPGSLERVDAHDLPTPFKGHKKNVSAFYWLSLSGSQPYFLLRSRRECPSASWPAGYLPKLQVNH
jgi:hypothetical protein